MTFPALYNGPVQYYARLIIEDEIILEQFDNYIKQTYRNRCNITGANGALTLSVPVKRLRGTKTLFKEIRVDYDMPWNKVHWKSLVAAYAASPFFEYFADDLVGFYEKRFGFLVDLNRGLMEKTLHFMGLEIPVKMSNEFLDISGDEDPRQFIHPKLDPRMADPCFKSLPYHQVFEDKHGFQPNLSFLDLLFNEGPNSLSVLKNSLRI